MTVSVHYLCIQNIQINLGKCIVAVYTIKNTSWIIWRRLEIQLGIIQGTLTCINQLTVLINTSDMLDCLSSY